MTEEIPNQEPKGGLLDVLKAGGAGLAPLISWPVGNFTGFGPPWPSPVVSSSATVGVVLVLWVLVYFFVDPTKRSRIFYAFFIVIGCTAFIAGTAWYARCYHRYVRHIHGHAKPEVIGYEYTKDAHDFVEVWTTTHGQPPDEFTVLDHFDNSVPNVYTTSSVDANGLKLLAAWIGFVATICWVWFGYLSFRRKQRHDKQQQTGGDQPPATQSPAKPGPRIMAEEKQATKHEKPRKPQLPNGPRPRRGAAKNPLPSNDDDQTPGKDMLF